MRHFLPKARQAITFLTLTSVLTLSCGAILHPERKGQPPGGSLDVGIVILDTVLLFLFVIPGVIAFVVDVSNNTLYLPAQPNTNLSPDTKDQELRKIHFTDGKLTQQYVESLIQSQTGKSIRVAPGSYQIIKLDDMHGISSAVLERLRATPNVVQAALK
jgi:hypothetical protein